MLLALDKEIISLSLATNKVQTLNGRIGVTCRGARLLNSTSGAIHKNLIVGSYVIKWVLICNNRHLPLDQYGIFGRKRIGKEEGVKEPRKTV